MRWSKLKQRIEEGFADAVQGRVKIWTTRYREAHDQYGEAWITVDGLRLHSMSSIRFEIDRWQVEKTHGVEHGHAAWIEGGQKAAERTLHSEGSMGLWSVNSTLFDYLSMSIEGILGSEVALVRGIGMLDRRLGKRRLSSLDTGQAAAFVGDLYRFRCLCEGVPPFVSPQVTNSGTTA